ncbi:family 78 glycoside hydrolase catalytic domain [Cohnella rhizosphaerae]|uniref:alpha-L-rhamnosidase n=1 Tax=Cohnella rhizosphaerae TaxID=1457232 RepID=A0A9X4KWX5_9BACL|nr:family 78 glycoside hydrolase catalytic domain [Cohnella rhizosphaerae]MDG0812796.1 family 78 glycoside hydrolase catalytic domain [Cohnella rhizosphaerae]
MVYFACLGYGELYLDGGKVGDHVLDPNWSDYDDRTIEGLLYPYDDNGKKSVYYVAYDITAELTVGKHRFGAMLGNGFYNQTARTVEGRMSYGTPRFLLQLNIQYADGSAERFVSDGSWRCECGPILYDNVFVGEVYDARREIEGWSEPGFDESDWQSVRIMTAPSGVLRAQQSPADKVMGTIRPISRTQLGDGCYVYDMGQNFSGWVRLRVRSSPAGSRYILRFAEELHPDGTLDFTSAGGTDQIQHDVYIAKGDAIEDYEPRFVWHGFRYVEISGFPGEPADDAAIGVIVHASVDSGGSFECSDETLNRIQRMYRWSQLSNLHGGVPSDCPHRERLGYTGDGHITAKAAMYNFGMASFYRKWVQDIGDAQNVRTGFVPHTAPFNGGGGGPGWGSAYVIVPWLAYRAYGDLSLLRDHYEGMKRWVDYLHGCTDDGCIVEREEPGSWCLGDWCIPGSIELPERVVNTYFHAYVTQLLGRIAQVLGSGEDQRRYEARYADICLAFNARFLDPDRNRYSIGRQGADLFAYALGCVPPEREPVIRNRLLMQYAEEQGGLRGYGHFRNRSAVRRAGRLGRDGYRDRAGRPRRISRIRLHDQKRRYDPLGEMGRAGIPQSSDVREHQRLDVRACGGLAHVRTIRRFRANGREAAGYFEARIRQGGDLDDQRNVCRRLEAGRGFIDAGSRRAGQRVDRHRAAGSLAGVDLALRKRAAAVRGRRLCKGGQPNRSGVRQISSELVSSFLTQVN